MFSLVSNVEEHRRNALRVKCGARFLLEIAKTAVYYSYEPKPLGIFQEAFPAEFSSMRSEFEMPRVVQMTISGIDGGGFVFQNVFHLQTPDTAADVPTLLAAACDEVNTNIMPPINAAMHTSAKILDIAAKVINPTTSYTIHKPVSLGGSRSGVASVGAVAGQLSFYPAAGTHVGRMFVMGGLIVDWVLDQIQSAYAGLLDNIAAALIAENGTAATYAWQFGIWNKSTPAFLPVVSSTHKLLPTTLNKRLRP